MHMPTENSSRDGHKDDSLNALQSLNCTSLGQILDEAGEHSRGLTVGLILTELCQNVHLHESLDEFETGVKGQVTTFKLREKPCGHH